MAMDRKYLEKHGGKFRVRVKVPKEARPIIGKKKITFGLGTDSLIDANRLKWEHVARIKAFINRAMKPGALPPDPIIRSALHLRKSTHPDKREHIALMTEELGVDLETQELEPDAAKFFNIATGAATPLTLLLEDWLTESKLAPRTEAKRRQSISELQAWLRRSGLPETIEAIDKRTAAAFKRDRFITRNVHPVTANSLLTGLRMFWRWLETSGHFTGDNPWTGLSLKKPRQSRLDKARPFTESEITKLFVGDSALPENRYRPAMLPIMAIGAHTGAAREEIFNLRVRDYLTDPDAVHQMLMRMNVPGRAPAGTRLLYFPISKNSFRERLVPVHPELVPILDGFAEGKGPNDFLVVRVQEQYNADRRDVLKNSEAKRFEPLARLKAMADQAEASAKLFSNPVAFATGYEIGSHERSRLYEQCRNQPPAALRTLATQAISQNSLILGAVLIAINEERERDNQSFDSSALAEDLFGSECRQALGALKIAARTFEDTHRSDRELQTGKIDGQLMISKGLKEKTDPSPALADLESETV